MKKGVLPMWPNNVYYGQFVESLVDSEKSNSKVVKGKVYTVIGVLDLQCRSDVKYMRLMEVSGDAPMVRHDLLKPLDDSRLDIFKGYSLWS